MRRLSSLFKKRSDDGPETLTDAAPFVKILGSIRAVDGSLVIPAFCNYPGVFASWDSMPDHRRIMMHVEVRGRPGDRPRHIRNLRALSTSFLDIRTEDLPMPGVFLEALETPEVKNAPRIYFACMHVVGYWRNLATTGIRSDTETSVVLPLPCTAGPDGWGHIDIYSARYQAKIITIRVSPEAAARWRQS